MSNKQNFITLIINVLKNIQNLILIILALNPTFVTLFSES
jgi:hypothetical protein